VDKISKTIFIEPDCNDVVNNDDDRKKYEAGDIVPASGFMIDHLGERHQPILYCTAWKDSGVCTSLCSGINPIGASVIRKTRPSGEKKRFNAPKDMFLYNKTMGGVDLADRLR
jgi:hypothetical protein